MRRIFAAFLAATLWVEPLSAFPRAASADLVRLSASPAALTLYSRQALASRLIAARRDIGAFLAAHKLMTTAALAAAAVSAAAYRAPPEAAVAFRWFVSCLSFGTVLINGNGDFVRRQITEHRQVMQFLRGVPRAVPVFGSARIPPGDPISVQGERLGRALFQVGLPARTGAGPGVMEAVLKGYRDARIEARMRGRTKNLAQGVRIQLPFEQYTNRYVETVIKTFSFVWRKFGLRRNAYNPVTLVGGFGSLDELFETWQRGHRPILLEPAVGPYKNFWTDIVAGFYAAWKEAGYLEEDLPVYPLITTDEAQAADWAHTVPRKPWRTPVPDFAESNSELADGWAKLEEDDHAAIVLSGRPVRDAAELTVARRLVHSMGSRLVRVISRGPLLKAVSEEALRSRWQQRREPQPARMLPRLQAVLFVPKTEQLRAVEVRHFPHRVITHDPSVHQVLSLKRGDAFINFPGTVTTMNRLFDRVQLMQTGIMPRRPNILVGRTFWHRFLDTAIRRMLEPHLQLFNSNTGEPKKDPASGEPLYGGLISPGDENLFQFVDTEDEVLDLLKQAATTAGGRNFNRKTHQIFISQMETLMVSIFWTGLLTGSLAALAAFIAPDLGYDPETANWFGMMAVAMGTVAMIGSGTALWPSVQTAENDLRLLTGGLALEAKTAQGETVWSWWDGDRRVEFNARTAGEQDRRQLQTLVFRLSEDGLRALARVLFEESAHRRGHGEWRAKISGQLHAMGWLVGRRGDELRRDLVAAISMPPYRKSHNLHPAKNGKPQIGKPFGVAGQSDLPASARAPFNPDDVRIAHEHEYLIEMHWNGLLRAINRMITELEAPRPDVRKLSRLRDSLREDDLRGKLMQLSDENRLHFERRPQDPFSHMDRERRNGILVILESVLRADPAAQDFRRPIPMLVTEIQEIFAIQQLYKRISSEEAEENDFWSEGLPSQFGRADYQREAEELFTDDTASPRLRCILALTFVARFFRNDVSTIGLDAAWRAVTEQMSDDARHTPSVHQAAICLRLFNRWQQSYHQVSRLDADFRRSYIQEELLIAHDHLRNMLATLAPLRAAVADPEFEAPQRGQAFLLTRIEQLEEAIAQQIQQLEAAAPDLRDAAQRRLLPVPLAPRIEIPAEAAKLREVNDAAGRYARAVVSAVREEGMVFRFSNVANVQTFLKALTPVQRAVCRLYRWETGEYRLLLQPEKELGYFDPDSAFMLRRDPDNPSGLELIQIRSVGPLIIDPYTIHADLRTENPLPQIFDLALRSLQISIEELRQRMRTRGIRDITFQFSDNLDAPEETIIHDDGHAEVLLSTRLLEPHSEELLVGAVIKGVINVFLEDEPGQWAEHVTMPVLFPAWVRAVGVDGMGKALTALGWRGSSLFELAFVVFKRATRGFKQFQISPEPFPQYFTRQAVRQAEQLEMWIQSRRNLATFNALLDHMRETVEASHKDFYKVGSGPRAGQDRRLFPIPLPDESRGGSSSPLPAGRSRRQQLLRQAA